jgi:hypothetical protein
MKKINKTTGIVNPETGKKDFEIEREDGYCELARREGSKFVVFDMAPASLSQCKEIVADWDYDTGSDEGITPCEGRGTWDCVHPAALLARIASCHADVANDPEVVRTLDAFGYIKPCGYFDIETAGKEYMKWKNQNGENK